MRNFITEIKNKTVKTLNVTTMKTKIHIMAVCLLSVVMVISCSKYEDDLVVDETMSQKSAQGDFEMQLMSTSSTVINIAPSSGYTSNSSVTIPAQKGMRSAVGGVIRARVLYRIGTSNSFTIVNYSLKIKKSS